jgi:hypothetical protein
MTFKTRALAALLLLTGHAAAAAPARGSVTEDLWSDYRIVMWQTQDGARLAGLRPLGISGARIMASRNGLDPAQATRDATTLAAAGLHPFIENIATDLYAAYHRYTPGKPVNWLYEETRAKYRANPADPSVYIREPSLSDPAWQARINARLAEHARVYGPFHPLYYNLGDESGIADLAAAWDFDFSPASLAGFRVWLHTLYPSLAALNREWGSDFATWSAVMPLTTDAALARTDGDYAGWSDFKDWMDEAFARALRSGTDALHAADPTARAAIEGGQGPGWGGYDYTRLARAVDVIEAYEGDNNIDIALAANPRLITLSTSFESGPQEVHRIWHNALLGERGLVLWDETHGFVAADGSPGPRGQALAGVFGELTGGIGAQLIASSPQRDRAAILASPASFRIRWLLDRKAEKTSWTERTSETEGVSDDPVRAATRRAASLLIHQGVQPYWLSPALLANGALERLGIRLLVLPHALALSPGEVAAVRGFVARGGIVLADVAPGAFDGHGRQLPHPALADLGTKIRLTDALRRDDAPADDVVRALEDAGVAAEFSLETPGGAPIRDVDVRLFRTGTATIIGLQRDLPAAASKADWVPGEARAAVLRLRHPAWLSDMRAPGFAAQGVAFPVSLDPVTPTVLAISPARLPAPTISGPASARAGESMALHLGLTGPSQAALHVVHIEARDPAGRPVLAYAANLALHDGSALWRLQLAADAAAGQWTILVRDMLGSGRASFTLSVRPAGVR